MGVRVAAALVAAATVWMTGGITARLGGSSFAQVLAMTATAVAPALLAVGSFYSMNVFDLFLWTLAARLLIDVLDRPALWRWIALGVVLIVISYVYQRRQSSRAEAP